MDEATLRIDAEDFLSSYRVFFEALRMLASSAEEQCQLMGDFNVAWELKDDVQAGKYLVGQGYLNSEQEAWLLALVGALEAVPARVLPAGAGRDTNMIAMQHPSWIPLRTIAAHVLEVLAPFSKEHAHFLA